MPVGSYGISSFTMIVGPKQTLRAAAQQMERERLGLLLVAEDERLLGVVSDRDVALEVAVGRRDADHTSVQDVMTQRTVTVRAEAPLEEAVAAMRREGVRRVPVLDFESRVVGILSADDLLRLFAGELGGLAAVAAAQSSATSPAQPIAEGLRHNGAGGAAEHYLKPVLCASRDASVEQVCTEMKRRALGCAVVVDGAGAAVGIVTDRDVALRVVARGLDPRATPVAAVMSAPLATAVPSAPLEEIFQIMRGLAVRRVPIASEGRPVGIVSFDDLVVCLGQELQAIGAAFARGGRGERIGVQVERVREEVGAKLEQLAGQLGQVGDQALRRIAREIAAVRERLRRTQH